LEINIFISFIDHRYRNLGSKFAPRLQYSFNVYVINNIDVDVSFWCENHNSIQYSNFFNNFMIMSTSLTSFLFYFFTNISEYRLYGPLSQPWMDDPRCCRSRSEGALSSKELSMPSSVPYTRASSMPSRRASKRTQPQQPSVPALPNPMPLQLQPEPGSTTTSHEFSDSDLRSR